MNILNILYTLIIGPLKLLFEVIYTLSYYVTQSAGLSVVLLSVAMNLLLLPLYNKADKIQEEENEIEKKLKPGVDHIKKSFKGDERYMILQAYYRQNNYKQTNVLKGSISLLLEVPFFIAAYDFLSNLLVLNNASFGPISNLSTPDRLLTIGSISINVLPILMTLFNIVSSAIYTKGQPLRSKIQLFGMAALFLILLYDSPSALLLYWTLNNVFSLVKNIIMKCKNPGLIFCYLLSICSICGIVFILINPLDSTIKQYGLLTIFVLLNIPLFLIKKNIKVISLDKLKENKTIFLLSSILFAILVGLLIPSAIVASSPSEFVDYEALVNPIVYILNTFVLAFGGFVIWFNIYYSLMNENVKKIFSIIMPIISIIGIIDYFVFGKNTSVLSNTLIFDTGLNINTKMMLINIVVVLIIIVLLFKIKLKKEIYIIGIICLVVMSSINLITINNDFLPSKLAIEDARKEIPTISLSKDKKNVVVIVLDRAISSYVPYLFEEDKNLQNQFSGFTYYPNTMSYGWKTILAMPSIFGGYEYTPEEMNKREDEWLVDKHNEALKMMPVLFDNNGYDVTVFDPPYANYKEIADLSIFNEYPNIKAYNTTTGMFENNVESVSDGLNRNLMCYGVMKAVPLCLQNILYNAGAYNNIDNYNVIYNKSDSTQAYVKSTFMNSYSVLQNLINMTDNKNEDPAFFIMTNYATHETTLLKEPEYEPQSFIDNTEYDKEHYDRYSINGDSIHLDTIRQLRHYQVNMASLKKLGSWFDYLKEIGVYDNTKIVVVSDHGHDIGQFKDLIIGNYDEAIAEIKNGSFDIEQYNPLLMYKDFNEKEFKISNDFMTNADVPSIVVKDTINNPTNPFTNKEISNNAKTSGDYQKVTISEDWEVTDNNNRKTFNIDKWLLIKDNVLDRNKWIIE